ncbi:chaperonin 10-like protein, partial [Lasiosphaeria miniovina]
ATSDIPHEMKAVQVVQYNQPYAINTVPVPQALGPHDLLVKVGVASYCHTDSMVRAGIFRAATTLPLTASHEGAGTVVQAGPAAAASFPPGTRVMCGLALGPCGACAECTTGPESERQYCAAHVAAGITVDGFFSAYVRADARTSTRVPDGVSLLTAAPLACAGNTVWRAVAVAGLKPGQWLAVVGAGGGLGHIGIAFAKALGLRVVGIDARDEGIALARAGGADVVVDARAGREAVVAEVQRVTGQQLGADATLALADADSAAALACAVTKKHGTVVQVAQPIEVKIPFQELIMRDIRIRGTMLASPGESDDMMRFVAEHGITVTTRPFYGLDSVHELLAAVEEGTVKGKAVIVVDEEQVRREKELGGK